MLSWQRRLAARVAFYDLVVAGNGLLGGGDAALEEARLGVVEVIDAALLAGVAEHEVDAELAAGRARVQLESNLADEPDAGPALR